MEFTHYYIFSIIHDEEEVKNLFLKLHQGDDYTRLRFLGGQLLIHSKQETCLIKSRELLNGRFINRYKKIYGHEVQNEGIGFLFNDLYAYKKLKDENKYEVFILSRPSAKPSRFQLMGKDVYFKNKMKNMRDKVLSNKK